VPRTSLRNLQHSPRLHNWIWRRGKGKFGRGRKVKRWELREGDKEWREGEGWDEKWRRGEGGEGESGVRKRKGMSRI